MTVTHQVLTHAEFRKRFKPIANHLNPQAPFDGCMFETDGPERDFVREHECTRVWTVIDCEGEMYVESGSRFANRLGYFIASVPREAHEHFTVSNDLPQKVTVSRRHLRFVLDYLHECEADHYEEAIAAYPDDAIEHVYWHVEAIEAELQSIGTAAQTAPALAPPFSLDAAESGDGYLTIDVAQRASIVVNASPEGIVVDVYNPTREGDPLGSTWVHASDLDDARDEAEVQP